jgi:hypothetical protein
MDGNTLLAISLVGFAIQQLLQVLADPVYSILIGVARNRQPIGSDGKQVLPGGISEVDAKKVLLGLTAID